MLKYSLRRLAYSVIILFFVMLIIYTLMYIMPGNYIQTKAIELATKPGATKSADEWLADLNRQYGMDQGLIKGYFTWLGSAFSGEFGDSWKWNMPCTEVFSSRIWYSFALNVVVMFFEILIAIPLGIHAARKQYGFADYFATVFAMVCISMPSFFLITILKLVFAVKLKWFDLTGMIDPRIHDSLSDFGKFLDVAKHFVLPAVALVIISIGGLMRYTRTNMLEVLSSDYIRTARAKGVPEHKVIYSHAFRNTLITLITILGGSLVSLFSGAIITEQLFGLEGIGQASYQSMVVGDIPFTMFYLGFVSILTLLGNLLSDLLYAAADPRVRLS